MANKLQTCPFCMEGHLHSKLTAATFPVGDDTVVAELQTSECDVCGADSADEKQTLANKRSVVRARKQYYGIPLGREIVAMRLAHGLSQRTAGAIFGGGDIGFSRYENDDVIPDFAMIQLLRLAISDPDLIPKLAQQAHVKLENNDRHFYLKHIKRVAFDAFDRGGWNAVTQESEITLFQDELTRSAEFKHRKSEFPYTPEKCDWSAA